MKTRLMRTGLVLVCLFVVRAGAAAEWSLIFHEGFENGGAMPSGWTQEYVDGSHDWVFVNGSDPYGVPSSAYSGSYNAFFFYDEADNYKTKLVSPAVEVGSEYSSARLIFWHYMKDWMGGQDELRVYYKTSQGGNWEMLATYTDSVEVWTQRIIDLPAAGQTYYIAFEGSTFWGFGVCVDEVRVEGGAGAAAEGFEAWAQENCPGMSLGEAFLADSDADGVKNGFEYALGTNLASGASLLNVLPLGGETVVDVPQQLTETEPYVSVYLQMARSLDNPGWNTNGIEAVAHAQKPAGRSWFKASEVLTNGFFRLRGELLQ